MTKFIKLHEVCGNDILKVVLLNADCIEHFKVGNKGTDTFVKMITPSRTEEGKGSWFFVKESVEEVEQLISDYPMAAPVMMDANEYTKANEYIKARGWNNDMGDRARAISIAKSLLK